MYKRQLVLCYDNDTAGKQSTGRVLNILKNANLNVRVLQLPNAYDAEGKPVKQDPDDFVKKFGSAAFEKCLNGSAGQNDYRLETLQQKHSLADEEGRMAFLREAVETVAALQSPIEMCIRDRACSSSSICSLAASPAPISWANWTSSSGVSRFTLPISLRYIRTGSSMPKESTSVLGSAISSSGRCV